MLVEVIKIKTNSNCSSCKIQNSPCSRLRQQHSNCTRCTLQ